jgi:hypothetical protein
MSRASAATTQQTTLEGGSGRTARRSRVAWPDVRRAVREAHECKLVHAVKVRRDGAIDLVIKRDDASARLKTTQPPPTAAPQQATKTRKQRRMERKDAFHQRQREKATAALGLLSSRPPGLPPTALLPPPPPASLIPPLTASFGAENVTMSARVDKREAAQVGADKTPTKPEETNAAEDESRANERSSSERKKTRGKPLFSDVTRGGPSRSDSGS